MKLRTELAILAAPTAAITLFAGGFFTSRWTATPPPAQVVVVQEIPGAVIEYAAEWQSALTLQRSGVALARRLQINSVLRRGGFYLVNITAVPTAGWGFQLRATLDARTLRLKSLVPLNGGGPLP